MDGSKFHDQFLNRVTQRTFLWNYFKIRPSVSEKNYLKNSISLPWQPQFLMESNSVNNFRRQPPKEHSCQVWSKLAQRFGRRRCLKKLLTTHDGHLTTLKAPLEHAVLRWAKKEKLLVTSNFSFSYNVFYSYTSQVCQNAALCGNGLKGTCIFYVVNQNL